MLKQLNDRNKPALPEMERRTFLALFGGAFGGYLTQNLWPTIVALAPNRAEKWAPNASNFVEWRYIAGRVVDGAQDFGFILAISNSIVPGFVGQQLLVERKDLTGDQTFTEKTYPGSREYDPNTGMYTFKDQTNQTLATWQWDDLAGLYRLTVNTPELSLTNLILKPQGEVIAEGGDGQIQIGRIRGFLIDSDYHADWITVEIGGQAKGTARIDMQGLRPSLQPRIQETGYDHHWFALAVELADGSSAWISAWRIEDSVGPYWTVTIAQGQGSSWQIVRALTEGNSATPLKVETLSWQDIPQVFTPGQPRQSAGRRWRLTAPDNSLNLELGVPPGQFITGPPLEGIGGPALMQEAIGLEATGTVLGQQIKTVKLVVAESTAEFYQNFIPVVAK